MTAIHWNQDTNDWSLTDNGGTTSGAIAKSMNKWLTGPKSPGLIVLEHELSDQSVAAFVAAYPIIKANGWTMMSVSQIPDGSAYQNAAGSNSSTVTPDDIVFENSTSTIISTSATSNAPAASGTSQASSKTNSAVMTWHGRTTSWMLSALLPLAALV